MYPSQRASKVAELPTRPIDLSGKRIVLLLQGGGALGGYQVGAFEALQAHLETIGRKIDWVVGISIGAINAAVIAGNRPEDLRPQYQPEGLLLNKDGKSRAPAIRPDRPSKLESLWKDILWPPADWLSPWSREYDSWLKACSAICSWSPLAPLVGKYIGWNLAAWGGQRNFFRSRLLSWENPWFAEFWRSPLPPGEAANYDTAPLRGLLTDPDKRYVDWDLINSPSGIQLSLARQMSNSAKCGSLVLSIPAQISGKRQPSQRLTLWRVVHYRRHFRPCSSTRTVAQNTIGTAASFRILRSRNFRTSSMRATSQS